MPVNQAAWQMEWGHGNIFSLSLSLTNKSFQPLDNLHLKSFQFPNIQTQQRHHIKYESTSPKMWENVQKRCRNSLSGNTKDKVCDWKTNWTQIKIHFK